MTLIVGSVRGRVHFPCIQLVGKGNPSQAPVFWQSPQDWFSLFF